MKSGNYGVIPGDLEAVATVVRALRKPTRRLRFVYEAAPCGFGIHRYLTAQGEDCVVVNPSSMPKRSGDRIKTDRRDGDALAPSIRPYPGRGSSATNHSLGGTQPADTSSVNRR